MDQPAKLPEPPYYAVIFASVRTDKDPEGYETMATRMVELAASMPGFLGIESLRATDGFGLTVSYWENEEYIRHWQAHVEHQQAQRQGRSTWYSHYNLRVCRVERAYGYSMDSRLSEPV